MLVGLYFAHEIGCNTPLFQLDDKEVQRQFFDNHVETMFVEAGKNYLVQYPNKPSFNDALFTELHEKCCDAITKEKVDDLMQTTLN